MKKRTTILEQQDFSFSNDSATATSFFDELRNKFPQLFIYDDHGNAISDSNHITDETPIYFGSGDVSNIMFSVEGMENYIPVSQDGFRFEHVTISKLANEYIIEGEATWNGDLGTTTTIKGRGTTLYEAMDRFERDAGSKGILELSESTMNEDCENITGFGSASVFNKPANDVDYKDTNVGFYFMESDEEDFYGIDDFAPTTDNSKNQEEDWFFDEIKMRPGHSFGIAECLVMLSEGKNS